MRLTPESPRHNLTLLWWLRTIAITGQCAAIWVVTAWLHVALPLMALFTIIGALALINLYTLVRLKASRPVTQLEFFIQLLADMMGLAGLLYFTGGASNPFTSLFILQVVIAAIVLDPLYSWLAASVSAAMYTLLMFCKRDLPLLLHSQGDAFGLHVEGMWINFMLLAVIVAWFVTRISATLRRQDALLAEAEQLASLGMLAAQAAHNLGTPLATLAILAGEYKRNAVTDSECATADVMLSQIARCKEGLSQVAASAGVMRAESGVPVKLDEYLRGVLARFQAARPAVQVEGRVATGAAPLIMVGAGLEQAIANLLANAADASPHWIGVDAAWSARELKLAIADRGAGLPETVRRSLGEPGLTTKQAGLGMGLYLSMSVIRRMGGMLRATTGNTGTIMDITLPLKGLMP